MSETNNHNVRAESERADQDLRPEEEDGAPAAEAADETTVALEEARAQAAEHYDRYLRAVAELDNFRKRTARMRSDTREETVRDMLLQIAPVMDNMRRALAQENATVEVFKQGVELIYSQLHEVLRGYGLEEIQALGQPFDPVYHEALLEVERGDQPPGTVVEEMEKGYRLRDKVVRPARVVVSKTGGENG
ncbi:MAG: nucleotide exchange factor GrpE [Candidatus Handelsmanbacteria bacterium]|nr:nucleotide exchange factor GrpE [Candidatus Handelsmanbacteria bacterium]